MIEIERKFLVNVNHQLPYTNELRITQGYLSHDPNRTVRVRVTEMTGFSAAYVTIKGKTSDNGLSRSEWEYAVPVKDAKDMLKLCTGVIDKHRYLVPHEGHTWEVDVFHGDNEGLVIAELELRYEKEPFKLPPWVTEEVTGDLKYYNSNLGSNPYKNWALKAEIEESIQKIGQKISDPEAYMRMVEQNKKFNQWCSIMGYFPHTKYFAAWQAALEANK